MNKAKWPKTLRNACLAGFCLMTLVIGGAASIFPAHTQEWLAEQIPGAEYVIFGAEEGGSHFMFYENPEKFNAVVEGFLD